MLKTNSQRNGFTLVELLVVLGLFLIVFTMSNVSLSGLIAKNSSSEFSETFVSDLNRQQSRAMTGDIASGSATAYGIKFAPTTYTLFSGTSHSTPSASNVVIQLPKDLKFENISFPQQQLVFAEGSGEVVGYVASASSVQLRNTTTKAVQTILANPLGVITVSP
jgi:prepilin-type N-terminal cleavage/methylation domain-containing protein